MQNEVGAACESAGALARRTGVAERTVVRALEAFGVKSNRKEGGYPIVPALEALTKHYHGLAESRSAAVEEDKAAKIKAEREEAELRAAKMKGELVSASSEKLFWADTLIQARNAVMSEPMPDKHKESIMSKMRKIRVGDREAVEE